MIVLFAINTLSLFLQFIILSTVLTILNIYIYIYLIIILEIQSYENNS